MPALETVGQYVQDARVLLQDTIVPYRYKNSELVDAINTGMLEVRRLRADLFLPVFTLPWVDPAVVDSTAPEDADAVTAILATKVPLDPMYRPSLIYYLVGKTQLRDEEATTDSRAAAFLTKFAQQMLTVAS
jgi:hypothetical protein